METALRLGVYLALFALMAGWESVAPRRPLGEARRRRWPVNLGLAVAGAVLARAIVGGGAYGVAVLAEARGLGLLRLVAWPAPAEAALALLALDLGLYLQHVMSHALPVFWRLHRVHHSDRDFDVTTGIRFHPAEIVVSMFYKCLLVAAIGPAPAVVVGFEMLLNGASLFNHGNVRLSPGIDRWLRWVLVTPDMHRVHHSPVSAETNANFGFALAFWDRLLGTYRAVAGGGPLGQGIGLSEYPDRLGFAALLALPFRRGVGRTSLRRDPDQARP